MLVNNIPVIADQFYGLPLIRRKMELPKICGIYKITSPTGGIYIGQANDIHDRKKTYKWCKCKGQERVYNSIKKHGWLKHKFEIIHQCEPHMLNHWEAYYVYFFDTFQTAHGLNLREGGGSQGRLGESTKKKIGEPKKIPVVQYDSNTGHMIKIWPSATEAKKHFTLGYANINSACIEGNNVFTAGGFIWRYYNGNNPNILSKEEIKKATTIIIGNERAVSQYTLDCVFVKKYDSLSMMNRETGFKQSLVSKVCLHHGGYTAYGYLWKFDDDDTPLEPKQKFRKKAPVLQFDLQDNFIAKFESASEAQRKTGAPYYGVIQCCDGKFESSGGFKWKHENVSERKEFKPKRNIRNILQYDEYGNRVNKFSSYNLSRQTGYDTYSIMLCCKGKRRMAYGYFWRFEGDTSPLVIRKDKSTRKGILQLDLSLNLIRVWNSLNEIHDELGFKKVDIRNCCNGYASTSHDFVWRYNVETKKPS